MRSRCGESGMKGEMRDEVGGEVVEGVRGREIEGWE